MDNSCWKLLVRFCEHELDTGIDWFGLCDTLRDHAVFDWYVATDCRQESNDTLPVVRGRKKIFCGRRGFCPCPLLPPPPPLCHGLTSACLCARCFRHSSSFSAALSLFRCFCSRRRRSRALSRADCDDCDDCDVEGGEEEEEEVEVGMLWARAGEELGRELEEVNKGALSAGLLRLSQFEPCPERVKDVLVLAPPLTFTFVFE